MFGRNDNSLCIANPRDAVQHVPILTNHRISGNYLILSLPSSYAVYKYNCQGFCQSSKSFYVDLYGSAGRSVMFTASLYMQAVKREEQTEE